MINIIVVTHGEFGAYLIEAAESIIGPQTEGIKNIPLSPRMSLEEISDFMAKSVDEMLSDDGLICLIDMPGGTPMNIILPLLKNKKKTAAICGVNLNMVICAFSQREKMKFEDLVKKMMDSINNVPKELTPIS